MPALPPLISAVLAQAIALLLMKLLAPLLPDFLLVQLLLQGGIAAMAGRLLKLPYWWVPINLVLPLAVVTTLSLHVPPWLFLLAFVALALFQWNSSSERVPLYLSNRQTWEALERLLPKDEVRFIDLGSGLGGTLFYLARRRPDSQFTGIESAPLPFAFAWCRLKLSGIRNLQIRYGNFWNEDLSRYNVVYAFLSPVPMSRLFEKAQKELPEGGRLISNSFTVPSQPADETVAVTDRRKTQLYCWRFNNSAC